MQRHHTDEELIGFLTSDNIRLESYYIQEGLFGRRICFTTLEGVEGTTLIEDRVVLDDCISFLKEKGARVID